jgi:putative phosphoesterase
MLVGVISDTHGLLRPQAVAALRGVDRIIHAGDIGAPEVLRDLARIAPVHAIRGNNDREPWAAQLPDTLTIEIGGVNVHVIHDVKEFAPQRPDAAVRVVISGHSHMPKSHIEAGILYLNPGSAGPRRFRLPVCVAHLRIEHGRADPRFIELDLR